MLSGRVTQGILECGAGDCRALYKLHEIGKTH